MSYVRFMWKIYRPPLCWVLDRKKLSRKNRNSFMNLKPVSFKPILRLRPL